MPIQSDASVRPIHWGIVGTGTMARNFAKGIAEVKGAVLWSVSSRSAEKAKTFAKIYSAKRSYKDFSSFLADDQLDVVYIATPDFLHTEQALLSLKASKPVVCEKPFATNLSDAKKVVELARKQNLFCMEGMWMRFFPIIDELLEQIKSGEIGKVRYLQGNFGIPLLYREKTRFFDPSKGSGSFFDLGCYPLSLAYALMGEPQEITCKSLSGPEGLEMQTTMILKYPSALASITSSYTTASSNDFFIYGSHGSVHLHCPIYSPQKITITYAEPHQPQAPSESIFESAERPSTHRKLLRFFGLGRLKKYFIKPANPRQKIIHRPTTCNGYHFEIEEVGRCLRKNLKESPRMPLDETIGVMRILDESSRHIL